MSRTFLKTHFWLTLLFSMSVLPALYGQANVTITQSADTGGTASTVTAVGQTVGFYMTVTSNGQVNATNVSLSDPLPNPGSLSGSGSGVNWYIDATTGSPSCSISGSAPYQSLQCSQAVLAPGNNFSVHVTTATTTASSGIYHNCATASADGVSPVESCDAISVLGACTLGYPYGTAPALTSVVFSESEDLVAAAACNASGCGEPVAGPNDSVALWYTDEHAMTLGIRRVAIKTTAGTTTTDYSITPLSGNPGTATNPQVGTTMLGNNEFFPNSRSPQPQAYPNLQDGTDTATWSTTYSYLDSSRPVWPALFPTDITGNPSAYWGDYQQGGTGALPPNAIFGTWKGAVRTVDTTVMPYAVTVTPDSDPARNNWSLGSGSDTPPGGFTQYSSQGWGTEVKWNINQVTINGQPLTAGHAYRLQIMVHDGDQNKTGGDTGEACINVVVPGTAGITLFCPNNAGLLNVPYSSELVATGGTAPYSFSITSGALPPGLSLNVSSGEVSGTPTTTGTFNFTAQVVDSLGNIATVRCGITITPPPPLVLACPPVATATLGMAYDSSLSATGGVPPYLSYSITSGSLPPGLSLDPQTGEITGTPTTAGNYSFTAKVVDSNNNVATVTCHINIAAPPPLHITCPPGPGGNGTVGTPYSYSLTATGGDPPYTFSISAGSLPPGLTLNPSTGAITGTPTTQGNYNFTAKVVDSYGNTATVNCHINVAAPPPLHLACPPGGGGNGTVGTAYNSSLTATGGVQPYTYSIVSGSLPPGLTLNPSTGAITGTPTTQGNYNFTAKVVDSYGNAATVNCHIDVAAPPPLHITCPPGGPANNPAVGQYYSQSVTATGGVAPYTFSIVSGSLPPGLTLNPSTGAITGVATTQGNYTFTVKVVDSYGNSATANCSINVTPPGTISLSCPHNSSATVGQPYNDSLTVAGGESPYTFSIVSGSLPPGLTLNPSTGAITGTPTTSGNYSYIASVVDSDHHSASASCSININPTISSPTACNPTSSLSVLMGQSGVTAYIPNGDWDISSATTGVQVVPIEPTGTPVAIATPNVVNSCASNSTTGQTVCTANNTDVYLISGTTLNNTLTSGSTGTTSFSGGICSNCGVAIESNSNTAVIAMGLSGSPSGSGLQLLNLANNTFGAPIPTSNEISEDVLWDPIRNLIVSPNEAGVYDLFKVQSGTLTEYANNIGGTLDSAGEDCLTGIGLSTDEYTSNIILTDLTQATYNSGTWSAPVQFQYIPEWDPYDGAESGTDGIAVATGTHLAIVTGEYPFPPSAANAVMVMQLPSTSGSGTPSLQDYAVATLPNDPMGYPFSVGCDPHTVTAYVSPISGKAIGLLLDYGPVTCYGGGTPQYVALVDLQGLLSAPRNGAHTVDPSYDLAANGIVTFVAAH